MLKKRATFLISQLDCIKKLKTLTIRVKKYKKELAHIMNRCQLSTDEYDHTKQQNDKVLNLVMFSSIYTPTKHLMENLEGCPYEELLKLLSKKFMKMDENETVRQCFLNVFKSHLSSQDILNDEDFDNIDLKPTLLEDISIFNDVIKIRSQKEVNVLNIIFSQTEKDIEKMGYKHHEEMKNILEQYKSIVNRQIELYKTYSNINQTLGINLFKADGEIDANEFEMLPLDEKTKKLFEKELRNSAFFDEFEINLAVLKVTKINERDPIGAIKVINKTKKLDELLNNERVQEDIIPEK